jgi:hypothetical protein
MARQVGPGGSSRLSRAHRVGRRAWPVVMMAWERWQSLPEEDKERHRRRAREYAERGRRAMEDARNRRGRRFR